MDVVEPILDFILNRNDGRIIINWIDNGKCSEKILDDFLGISKGFALYLRAPSIFWEYVSVVFRSKERKPEKVSRNRFMNQNFC